MWGGQPDLTNKNNEKQFLSSSSSATATTMNDTRLQFDFDEQGPTATTTAKTRKTSETAHRTPYKLQLVQLRESLSMNER